MTEEELLLILKDEGWSVSKDEVGDSFCTMTLDSLLLQLIPTIRKRSDHYRIALSPSVSSSNFSNTVSQVASENNDFEPIVVSNFAVEKIASPSVEDIVRLSEEAITWAKKLDIDEGLKKYRDLPTSSKGAMPLRHLAALAIHGDTEKLTFYRDSFLKGERLGFVPYITLPMLEKALHISHKDNLNLIF